MNSVTQKEPSCSCARPRHRCLSRVTASFRCRLSRSVTATTCSSTLSLTRHSTFQTRPCSNVSLLQKIVNVTADCSQLFYVDAALRHPVVVVVRVPHPPPFHSLLQLAVLPRRPLRRCTDPPASEALTGGE